MRHRLALRSVLPRDASAGLQDIEPKNLLLRRLETWAYLDSRLARAVGQAMVNGQLKSTAGRLDRVPRSTMRWCRQQAGLCRRRELVVDTEYCILNTISPICLRLCLVGGHMHDG
jgi:hypothetical protein